LLQVKPEGDELWALGKKEKDFGGWLFKKGMGTPRGMSYAQQAIAGGKTVESAITANTFSYGKKAPHPRSPPTYVCHFSLIARAFFREVHTSRLSLALSLSLCLSLCANPVPAGYDEGPSKDQVLQARKKVAKGGERGRSGTRLGRGPPRADSGWGNRHRKRKAQVRPNNPKPLFEDILVIPLT
jgi:hypothetical protein